MKNILKNLVVGLVIFSPVIFITLLAPTFLVGVIVLVIIGLASYGIGYIAREEYRQRSWRKENESYWQRVWKERSIWEDRDKKPN